MTAIRITPPATLPVDLAMAKANMRVDGNDMDALIASWIGGIVAALEHEIGQCLIAQGWRVTAECFEAVSLPHPVMEVNSIKYVDQAGAEQTLDPAACRLQVGRYQSALLPARGATWPATLADSDVVTIELQAGYGAAPADVPENVKLYILAKLVEQFDPITRMERDTVQSAFVDRLLDACRSYA